MCFIFGGAGKEKLGWLLHLEEKSLMISTLLCAEVSLEVDQNCLEGKRWASPKVGLPLLLPFNTPETSLLFQGACEEDTALMFSQKGEML